MFILSRNVCFIITLTTSVTVVNHLLAYIFIPFVEIWYLEKYGINYLSSLWTIQESDSRHSTWALCDSFLLSEHWNLWWWRRLWNYTVCEKRMMKLESLVTKSNWCRAEKPWDNSLKKIITQCFSSLMKLPSPSSTHRKQNTWNTFVTIHTSAYKICSQIIWFCLSKSKLVSIIPLS